MPQYKFKYFFLIFALASLLLVALVKSNVLFAQELAASPGDMEGVDDEEICGADCGDEETEEDICNADKWSCGDWSLCSEKGAQTRTCKLALDCDGVDTPQPQTLQSCKNTPPSSKCIADTWKCEAWGACSEKGAQTRTCKLVDDCKEVETPKPAITQECKYIAPDKCTADKWECESFSACGKDGLQSRTCKLAYDCKDVKTQEPATQQKCTFAEPPPPSPQTCTKDDWDCATWSPCGKDGLQSRTCKLAYDCKNVKTQEPATQQKCTFAESPPPPPQTCTKDDWACGTWGSCGSNGVQTRTCELTSDCPAVRNQQPADMQFCAYTQPAVCDAGTDNDRDGLNCQEDDDDSNPDVNGNHLLDGLDGRISLIGAPESRETDTEEQNLRAQEASATQQLITSGTSAEEAYKIVRKEFKIKRAERKVKKIRSEAARKYGVNIGKNTEDSDGDGFSDEVAVQLGINPKAKKLAAESLSLAELKIYSSNAKLLGKKCTTNIYSGYKLSSDGFAVLAACPKNKYFTLFAIDRNGRQTAVATKKSSENNKIVFAVDKKFQAGRYLFQVRGTPIAAFAPSFLQASSLNDADLSSSNEDSEPILVDILTETDIAQPTVKNIEGIDVLDIKDIQVVAGSDGKIHVSGTSDISTMVVGTFQSAVFTSALLADVENGNFEIVSPEPLPLGEHEVVIYATRPEESTQSEPIRLTFELVQTAKAAPIETVSPNEAVQERPVADEPDIDVSVVSAAEDTKKFPLVPVVGFGGVALLIIIVALLIRRKKPGPVQ